MKLRRSRFLALLTAIPIQRLGAQGDFSRLPNGKSRRLAILRDDHKKSLEDIGEIIQLAREVESSLEENREHVLDLKSFEKMERIEKLSKQIQGRMKRVH